MNTTATPPEAIPAPNIQALDFSSEAKTLHRKIAKLPKPLRDLINSSLDDGLPAKEIIQKLEASTNPPLPYTISEANVSRWKNTGYQRYLAHLDHLDSIEASREAALEMVATNNLSLPQATLQVIASQCFEILADFSAASFKQKLAEDPLKYTSFLHVFARLTREMVHLEKFHDARAAAQADESDPNRDRKAEAVDFWTRHTKRLFNRKDLHRVKSVDSKELPPHSPASPKNNPEGIASFSPGLRGTSYPGIETSHATNLERVASDADNLTIHAKTQNSPSCEHHPSSPDTQQSLAESAPSVSPSPIENQNGRTSLVSKFENLEEHCLDCHHPLPPLTPEGKRPFERCQVCNILLPPPGTCTRPSADKCHHCGATLPRRLPSGRRPKYVCHNCGCGLGRELDEDIQKYAEK